MERYRAREIDQMIRALAVHLDGSGLIPRIHKTAHKCL